MVELRSFMGVEIRFIPYRFYSLRVHGSREIVMGSVNIHNGRAKVVAGSKVICGSRKVVTGYLDTRSSRSEDYYGLIR